ncbi:MAG: ion channel [Chloroflexota bacterium]|nr:ion channel [Chloroflexota bacterium]
MIWLAPILGVALLLTLLRDVYSTVLVPRGQAGPVTRGLYAGTWSAWRWFGDRLHGQQRRRWLSLLGPLLVPLTVVMWVTMLVASYALIYYPWAGGFTVSSSGNQALSAWTKALYVSGYSATTLGVGDVVPDGVVLRLLIVLEAGHGFILFSLAVTYLLSIYTALNRSTALALEISQFVGRAAGKHPADVLITMARSGTERDVLDWLARTASIMASVAQSEGQYPLLRYFHVPDDDRALPVVLTDLLEIATLARSVLSPAHFPAMAEGPVSPMLERLIQHHLHEGVRKLGPDATDGTVLERERRESYQAARQQLEAAGVAVRAEPEAWPAYARLRAGWDTKNRRIRTRFGYPECEAHDAGP